MLETALSRLRSFQNDPFTSVIHGGSGGIALNMISCTHGKLFFFTLQI